LINPEIENMSATKPFDRLDYIYKLLVIIAITIVGLSFASDIVIPMAFAALFSIVLQPLVKRLERRKVPSVLAISIVLLLTIFVLVLVIWVVIQQVSSLLLDLPDLQVRIENFIDQMSQFARESFNISKAEQNKMVGEAMTSVSSYLGDLLLTTSHTLSMLIQVPIYIFLILIYRDKFRNFFVALLPGNTEFAWKKSIDRVIRGYISGLMLVTLIIATMNSIGLMIVGIDHAIFFGILSGLLTIIPYVGITIGAAFPILMALITKDSIWYAVAVLAVFSFTQFLEGNFISPRITGSKVSINALAAIIALVIGGKILGIPGMILAVPAIGVVRVLLSHSYYLKPFVILLEDKSDIGKKSPPAVDAMLDEFDKKEEPFVE
jgi:predicted PurR-regulated permease PerM